MYSKEKSIRLLSLLFLGLCSIVKSGDVRSSGAYIRKSMSGSSVGNFSYDVTPSQSYGSGVNQIIGLAFGNDNDSITGMKSQQRLGAR